MLDVGSPAPALHATAHDGTVIDLAALRGRHVVVYFYPKDETPGCTKEACSFRDSWQKLSAAGIVLVGVSNDSVESHKGFAEHHKLPFQLLSDGDGAIARAFGVPTTMGFLARQTFVVGPDGKLKAVHRKVDVAAHAEEILREVGS